MNRNKENSFCYKNRTGEANPVNAFGVLSNVNA